MSGYLFDACALIALLNDEPGAAKVETLLAGDGPHFMSAVNVLEVAYDAVRRMGRKDVAQDVLNLVQQAGIVILWSFAPDELVAAAQWKARGRLSLADAIALGIAERKSLRLVSADHHELDPLEAAGLVQIEWVR